MDDNSNRVQAILLGLDASEFERVESALERPMPLYLFSPWQRVRRLFDLSLGISAGAARSGFLEQRPVKPNRTWC